MNCKYYANGDYKCDIVEKFTGWWRGSRSERKRRKIGEAAGAPAAIPTAAAGAAAAAGSTLKVAAKSVGHVDLVFDDDARAGAISDTSAGNTTRREIEDCKCKQNWYHYNDNYCGCAKTNDHQGGQVPWCKTNSKSCNQGKGWRDCTSSDLSYKTSSSPCDCKGGCSTTSNHENGTVPWCYTKGDCNGKNWKECNLSC